MKKQGSMTYTTLEDSMLDFSFECKYEKKQSDSNLRKGENSQELNELSENLSKSIDIIVFH